MKTMNCLSAAIAIALVFTSAGATDAQPQGFTREITEVPTNSVEWFQAGKQAVRNNKLASELPNLRRAKNVILFVGDGMGISTVTAARILEGQQRGADGEFNRLSFERFPYFALSVTASANQQTSDSAPTATAMVAGIKTNDGAVSVDQTINRTEPSAEVTAAKSVKTILERAEIRGMSTGVVTTARLTHATPAVNFAHISNRDWEANNSLPAGATVKDIARQLIEFPYGNGLEVALGGGRSYFTPRPASGGNDPEYPSVTGRRTDGRDLTAEWTTKYPRSNYVWNKAQFDAINPWQTDHLLGLFEPSHVKYEHDRATDPAGEPSLVDMTRKAIEILKKNRKGFYLMVEAGRIDHAHHAGNAHRALTDTIQLAEAVKMAQQLTRDEETLIIVTADHSHTLTIAGYPSRGNPILGKADSGLGLIGIAPLALDSLGLPYTTLGYHNGPGGWTGNFQRRELLATPSNGGSEGYAAAPYIGGKLRPDLTDIDTTNPNYLQEAAIPTVGAETHAGEEVGIYASGPRAYLFRGTMEQNAIYHVMADALGF
jgi:alkaline phosphatase